MLGTVVPLQSVSHPTLMEEGNVSQWVIKEVEKLRFIAVHYKASIQLGI